MDQSPPQPKSLGPLAWITIVVLAGGLLAVALWIIPQIGSDNRNTQIVTDGNQTANLNQAANTNIVTNANAVTNVNVAVITNSRIPNGWTTYESSTSEFAHIKALDPSFSVSFPSSWRVHEDLGGVTLAEAGVANLEPQIGISRSFGVNAGDVIEVCKQRASGITGLTNLVYDEARTVEVSGIDSAYLRYHIPESAQTHPSSRDAILVCIPLTDETDTFWARPYSSDLVSLNFDTILSTYSIDSGE